MLMKIKKILRRFGFDIVRYHSFWDDIAQPRGIKTILDIGANDGSFARSMRARFSDAGIISFEPLHHPYAALVENMKGDEKFNAYNTALGEHAGETVIHRSASDPSSSLLPMAELHKKLYPKSAEHTDETIRIARLDDVIGIYPLERPVLVKIDVQGFEAGVIRGGTDTLRKADIVLVENSFVTLYEGQALFAEIHHLLHGLGFSYRGRSETHYDPTTKEPVYEDSVFIKDNS
jgi:FkbM family methyltransferase